MNNDDFLDLKLFLVWLNLDSNIKKIASKEDHLTQEEI